MKEHNIRFDGDDKEMHQVYDLLLHHVKCSEKNGIDHPRLFAIGACQLGLFPRIPKFGSQAGHTWMYEGESSSIFTNSKLYHIQEEFTQILESSIPTANIDTDTDTDGDSNKSSDSASRSDSVSNLGEDGPTDSTSAIRSASLLWSAAKEKSKGDKRRMSFLWGRPLEISEVLKTKEKSRLLARVQEANKQQKNALSNEEKKKTAKKKSGRRATQAKKKAKMKRRASNLSKSSQRGKKSIRKGKSSGDNIEILPSDASVASNMSARAKCALEDLEGKQVDSTMRVNGDKESQISCW